ncbi:MAG: type II secretion system protein [Planctomycetia bacterium]|nr:type II secretion system protein [Planctomycetia bacterium]
MRQRAKTRQAFTLVELMLVIMIIAMLGAMTVVVSRSALEMAKRSKTEMTVARIDGVITAMYEKYQYRKVDLTPYLNAIGYNAAGSDWWYTQGASLNFHTLPQVWKDGDRVSGSNNITNDPAINRAYYPPLIRLHVIRDTVRMDMPCWAAEIWGPITPDGGMDSDRSPSALNEIYRDALYDATGTIRDSSSATSYRLSDFAALSRIATWDIGQQATFNAELLYLVVMNGDTDARSIFSEREIGDTNDNGLPEFLDGWGNPIHWFRQPVGLPETDRQDGNGTDPLDPLDMDTNAFLTIPIIVSSGPDGLSGLDSGQIGLGGFGGAASWSAYTQNFVYPFQLNTACGAVDDPEQSKDNIHSHRVVR